MQVIGPGTDRAQPPSNLSPDISVAVAGSARWTTGARSGNLDASSRQGLIVESLAALIIKAGYHLVAEGIETEMTLQNVTQLGFSGGQGYLLGRPGKDC